MTGKDKIDNMIKKFVNKRTINCSGGLMTMTGMECIMKVLDKDSKAKKVCHDKIIYACAKTLNKMFKQNEWSLEAKDGQVLYQKWKSNVDHCSRIGEDKNGKEIWKHFEQKNPSRSIIYEANKHVPRNMAIIRSPNGRIVARVTISSK